MIVLRRLLLIVFGLSKYLLLLLNGSSVAVPIPFVNFDSAEAQASSDLLRHLRRPVRVDEELLLQSKCLLFSKASATIASTLLLFLWFCRLSCWHDNFVFAMIIEIL